jgi:hypothetical protein
MCLLLGERQQSLHGLNVVEAVIFFHGKQNPTPRSKSGVIALSDMESSQSNVEVRQDCAEESVNY